MLNSTTDARFSIFTKIDQYWSIILRQTDERLAIIENELGQLRQCSEGILDLFYYFLLVATIIIFEQTLKFLTC